MAIRKQTQKQQVAELMAAQAPNEQMYDAVLTMTGMSPYIVVLSAILNLFRKYYFLVLTQNNIMLVRAAMFTGRPRAIENAIPLNQVRISDVHLNPLWSNLRFLFPGKSKPSRINVHRIYRTELEQVLGAVQQSGGSVA
jgi:hypothetical protein